MNPFDALAKLGELGNKYAPAINVAIGAAGLYQAHRGRQDAKKQMKRQTAVADKAEKQAQAELAFTEKRMGYRRGSSGGLANAGVYGLYSKFHQRPKDNKTGMM